MGEWKKIDDGGCSSHFRRQIGPVVLEIRYFELSKNWAFDLLHSAYAELINGIDEEQAQAAALAWARKVLGQAMVDAGADVDTEIVCSECRATGAKIGLPCWITRCNGVMRELKTVMAEVGEA